MTSVDITIGPDRTARLRWDGAPDRAMIATAAAQALDQADRVEAEVADTDVPARRALHQAGFRSEGVRRRALPGPGGAMLDARIYARLADDEVAGPLAFSQVMNTVLPRTRLIAHVLFRRTDPAGGPMQYLFCQTVFKTDWELPGGVVEPGESPRTGAVREVAEELGLAVEVGEVLAVDWLPPYLGWDDALELIFDGGELSAEQCAAMVLQPSEIAAVHWTSAEQAYPMLRAGAARRLKLITERPGATHYLEDGDPPG
ncbi:NUDIX hydrolase [Naumannella cuiyingiana]|uniref:8-oxo-dGTP pyrophosphatase MutT (NUDIX family) n=1 Tax=Naumannella cuiyingiana TaxID=1347891 RepID=A0A7Z0D6J2_9ACTN|nr:NUDIX hydrolase [Naumannella cuiyingiana]NYI69676.1 8-oxo-dGTP pyrophosphatase MutT (NUDIX family) [Naumannella cuiyingiana]